MRVAIVTFDGFNELDTFLAFGLVNRLRAKGVSAELAAPVSQVTSMNGVTVTAQRPLAFAHEADAVLFGSGLWLRAQAEDPRLLDAFTPDPTRQLFAGQGSGVLLMARLGLLGDRPACTDPATRPHLVEAGVAVVDLPFQARGPVATAGGCLAATYLATWLMWRAVGKEATRQQLQAAAPVGEKEAWAERTLAVVAQTIGEDAAA